MTLLTVTPAAVHSQSAAPLIPGGVLAAAEKSREAPPRLLSDGVGAGQVLHSSLGDASRLPRDEFQSSASRDDLNESEDLPPQGATLRRLAGVTVDRWERSPLPESGYRTETQRIAPSDLHLLEFRISYDACASLDTREYIPSLLVKENEDGPTRKGFKNLARNEFFRQVRRIAIHQWRGQFRDSPTITFDQFETRMVELNRIGRNLSLYDDAVASDYSTQQARARVFRRSGEGEEIPVLSLGPLVLFDSGSLSLDPSLVSRFLNGKDSRELVEVGPAPGEDRRPLISGKNYRVNTRFRVDLDPFRTIATSNPADTWRSMGTVVEVTWLSDILRRELFRTQVEGQVRRNGEWAFYLNFVIRSR